MSELLASLNIDPEKDLQPRSEKSTWENLSESFLYEGQQQLKGLAQTVGQGDAIGGRQEPEQAQTGIGQNAQMFGRAAADMIPIIVTGIAARAGLGKWLPKSAEPNLFLQRSVVGLNAVESGTTGLVSGALFRPSDDEHTASLSSFIEDRAKGGASGAVSFMAFTGLNHAATKYLGGKSIIGAALTNPIGNGLITGAPAGFLNAQIDSVVQSGNINTDMNQIGKSMYEMTMIGGAFGALTASSNYRARISKQSEISSNDRSEAAPLPVQMPESVLPASPAGLPEVQLEHFSVSDPANVAKISESGAVSRIDPATAPIESVSHLKNAQWSALASAHIDSLYSPNSHVGETKIQEPLSGKAAPKAVPPVEAHSGMGAKSPDANMIALLTSNVFSDDHWSPATKEKIAKIAEKFKVGFADKDGSPEGKKFALPGGFIDEPSLMKKHSKNAFFDGLGLTAHDILSHEVTANEHMHGHSGMMGLSEHNHGHMSDYHDHHIANHEDSMKSLFGHPIGFQEPKQVKAALETLKKHFGEDSPEVKELSKTEYASKLKDVASFVDENPSRRAPLVSEMIGSGHTPNAQMLRGLETLADQFGATSSTYQFFKDNSTMHQSVGKLAEFISEKPETRSRLVADMVRTGARAEEFNPGLLRSMETLREKLGSDSPAMKAIEQHKQEWIAKLDKNESPEAGADTGKSNADKDVNAYLKIYRRYFGSRQTEPATFVNIAKFLDEDSQNRVGVLERAIENGAKVEDLAGGRLAYLEKIESVFGADSELSRKIAKLEPETIGNIALALEKTPNASHLIQELVNTGTTDRTKFAPDRISALHRIDTELGKDSAVRARLLELESNGFSLGHIESFIKGSEPNADASGAKRLPPLNPASSIVLVDEVDWHQPHPAAMHNKKSIYEDSVKGHVPDILSEANQEVEFKLNWFGAKDHNPADIENALDHATVLFPIDGQMSAGNVPKGIPIGKSTEAQARESVPAAELKPAVDALIASGIPITEASVADAAKIVAAHSSSEAELHSAVAEMMSSGFQLNSFDEVPHVQSEPPLHTKIYGVHTKDSFVGHEAPKTSGTDINAALDALGFLDTHVTKPPASASLVGMGLERMEFDPPSQSPANKAERIALVERLVSGGATPEQLTHARLDAYFDLEKELGAESSIFKKIIAAENNEMPLFKYLRLLTADSEKVGVGFMPGEDNPKAVRPDVLEKVLDGKNKIHDFSKKEWLDLQAFLDANPNSNLDLSQILKKQRQGIDLQGLASFIEEPKTAEQKTARRQVVEQLIRDDAHVDSLNPKRLRAMDALNSLFGADSPALKTLLGFERSTTTLKKLADFLNADPATRVNLIERVLQNPDVVKAHVDPSRLDGLAKIEKTFGLESDYVRKLLAFEENGLKLTEISSFLEQAPSTSLIMSTFGKGVTSDGADGARVTVGLQKQRMLQELIDNGAGPDKLSFNYLNSRYKLSEYLGADSTAYKKVLALGDQGLNIVKLREFIDEDPNDHKLMVQRLLDSDASIADLSYSRLRGLSILINKLKPNEEAFNHLLSLEKRGLVLSELAQYISEDSKSRVPQINTLLENGAGVKELNVKRLADAAMLSKIQKHFGDDPEAMQYISKLQVEGLSANRLMRFIEDEPESRKALVKRLISEGADETRFNQQMSLSLFPDDVSYQILDAAKHQGNGIAHVLGALKNWETGPKYYHAVVDFVREGNAPTVEALDELNRRVNSGELQINTQEREERLSRASRSSARGVEVAGILQQALERIDKTIPKDQNIVLLGRDNWPLLPSLRAQGRPVQYFLWSRLQGADPKTKAQWLKEVPPNSAVIDTGYSGSIIDWIRNIDPSAKGYLLSSSGRYPQLLTGHQTHMVQKIEYFPKLIGRSKTYTDNGGAVSKNSARDGDEEKGQRDLNHRWFVQGANADMLRALDLPEWDVWRFSDYVGLTPKERLGLDTDAQLQQHFMKVEQSRQQPATAH